MLKMVQLIFINNSICIGFMVLNEKADIIFATLIEVLLCTSEAIEVFYFHDVLEVMGKRWTVFLGKGGLFLLRRHSPSLLSQTKEVVMKGF